MPIYQFICTKCGHSEEKILCIKDRDKDQECNGATGWRKCRYSMVRVQTPVMGIVKNPAVPRKAK